MNNQFDVIIVGGGIIGHSISYSLAKRGIHALVLEKERINEKATSAAAGMLAVLSEVTDDSPLYEIARKSRNMFPALMNELYENTRIDIELIQKGMLTIAHSDSEVKRLQKMIQFHQSKGESASWIPTAQLKELEPNLTSTIFGAMHAPNDGHVSPVKLASAYAEGAKRLGGSLLEYTEVTELLVESGRVTGVKTNTTHYYSDHVVVAGGAWTSQLLKELPIIPVKGECFSVTSREELVSKTIFSDDCYIVPKQGNRMIVGATVIPGTYDENVNVNGVYSLLNKAIQILPQLKEAKWEKVWAGIRPQTIDHFPVMGEYPNIKGLYVATGHYRNGILLSPITGEMIACMITGEEEFLTYQHAFSLQRRGYMREVTN